MTVSHGGAMLSIEMVVVDNLVVMDYGMQGEVYNSGYVKEHKCWFADFDPLPRDVVIHLKWTLPKMIFMSMEQIMDPLRLSMVHITRVSGLDCTSFTQISKGSDRNI